MVLRIGDVLKQKGDAAVKDMNLLEAVRDAMRVLLETDNRIMDFR